MPIMTSPSESREPQGVRFILDGEVVTAPPLPATTTLLDYLREVAGRTGTKEGCAEGDCGACTVVLGRPCGRDDGAAIEYRAINSCIRFLPTIDGYELVTVESLQAADGTLHPVQQAMVDAHASQCGFCTPGFVMSLFALYQNRTQTTPDEVIDTLSGNLCRCTGYRPIIDAGCASLGLTEPERWSRQDAQSPARVAALRAIQRESALRLPGFVAPRTLDAMSDALESEPASLVLAGGTDIGLWVTQHLRDLPPLVYTGEVAELQAIRHTGQGIEIGAAVPLSTAWPALVAVHPWLAELARRFASLPVCNSGTLGGNVANGSPIGDSMPALLALGASIRLRSGSRERVLPLEHFYLGYQKKDLAAGEFLVSISVPPPEPDWHYRSYKLAKRIDQDISAVCGAFAVEIVQGLVADARLAFGGMAAIPSHAVRAETALIGLPWSAASVELAVAALAQDFKPLSDMRASSAYRLQAAGSLLRRFWLESSGAVVTRTSEVVA